MSPHALIPAFPGIGALSLISYEQSRFAAGAIGDFQFLLMAQKVRIVKILCLGGAFLDARAAFNTDPVYDGDIIEINGPHGAHRRAELAVEAIVVRFWRDQSERGNRFALCIL